MSLILLPYKSYKIHRLQYTYPIAVTEYCDLCYFDNIVFQSLVGLFHKTYSRTRQDATVTPAVTPKEESRPTLHKRNPV